MLVCEYLSRAAHRFPAKIALIRGQDRYTYTQLYHAANSVANWLTACRYPQGFRGGILTDDPFEYVSLYFGIQQAGGIVVGLNTQTAERSLLATLGDCGAAVVFANSKFARHLDKVADRLSSLKHIVCDSGGEAGLAADSSYERASLTDVLLSGNVQPPSLLQPLYGSNIAQIIYTSGTTGTPKGVMLRHKNLIANTES
ncbi:MAG: acyl--CoA ligase, partial [Desulfobacteraceae bacterium]|nr:acyl--CoA ligase [Desulfobacteraceae bacterium]